MDKKETGEYEEEKGTGSEAKKMGNERMGENEEVCPFENILFCPGTLTEIGQPSLSYKRRKRARIDILRKPKTR